MSNSEWKCPACGVTYDKAPYHTRVCAICTRRCDWLAKNTRRVVEDLGRMVNDLAELDMVWSVESADFAREALADLAELERVAIRAAQACRTPAYQDSARWANAS